ncbi:MAG TPA: hypothetical protein VMQ44_02895 [Candidatus Saccharimonadales bacterium]|nr:hypothetical protein [Candidatus Saccharimonadales bacterium]
MTRPRYYIVIFWLVDIAGLAVAWRWLPTVTAQVALVIALAILIGFSLADIYEPLFFGTFAFTLLLINYLEIVRQFNPLLISLMTAGTVLIIGQAAEHYLTRREKSWRQISYWLILAFLIAQAQMLVSYWPVSMFNRTSILLVIFYGLWQMFRFQPDSSRLAWVAHFVYIGVAAIVIVGTIIWANYPQLLPF